MRLLIQSIEDKGQISRVSIYDKGGENYHRVTIDRTETTFEKIAGIWVCLGDIIATSLLNKIGVVIDNHKWDLLLIA